MQSSTKRLLETGVGFTVELWVPSRAVPSLEKSLGNMSNFSRDITQAYMNIDRDLERQVYINAPK